MKMYLIPTYWLSLLFICFIAFSSFSTIEYSRNDSRDNQPQVSQKDKQKNKRLDKREQKLKTKLAKAKTQKKRKRIQKRIRGIKKQKEDFGSPIFGLLGMIISILGVGAYIVMFILNILNILFGFGIIAAIGLVLGIIGLGLSITGIILNKKNPQRWTKRGFAIAGMIIGIIVVTALAAFLIALLFL